MRRARRDQQGAVTAELALGIPLLLVVTWSLVWLLSLVLVQVRTLDAAREAARALARGDSEQVALAAARRVAPPGAQITIGGDEGSVSVTVRARAGAPGGGLLHSMAVTVEGHAESLVEQGPAP